MNVALLSLPPSKRRGLLFRVTPTGVLAGSTFTRATTGTYVDNAGLVQTAAINALRSGHFVGGVQTILLEGASTNACLWSNDLTNIAWTKRGTCAVAKTATGPDGVANSATAITGLGASGNDVFQIINGLVTATRGEPHVWIQRVTTSGTISLQNASNAANGNWTIDLAQLGAGWVRVTRAHAAVTIVAEFTTGATTSAGFLLNGTGGGSAINVFGTTYEPAQTTSSSTIPTTTVAVTRATDALSWPGVSPSGTYYERWLDENTGVVTDSVAAYTAGTTITPALTRAYTNIKIAAGTQSLATMRAL